MSLSIDVDEVTAVLLADGWHEVKKESFALDAYEFVRFGSEERRQSGDPMDVISDPDSSTGFAFIEGPDTRVCGPITAILAVRVEETRAGPLTHS